MSHEIIPYRQTVLPQSPTQSIIVVQQTDLPAVVREVLRPPERMLREAAKLSKDFDVSVRVYRKITITEE